MVTRTIRTAIYRKGLKVDKPLKREVMPKGFYKQSAKKQKQQLKEKAREKERTAKQKKKADRDAKRKAEREARWETKHVKRTLPAPNYKKWEEKLARWKAQRDKMRM